VLLLDYFRRQLNRQFRKNVEGFTKEAEAALIDYDWPGNVRELKNMLEATFISAPQMIAFEDLAEFFRNRLLEIHGSQDERTRLLGALFETKWNKTKAAQLLQWSRMTLYRKMEHYQIVSPSKENGYGKFSAAHGNL
jgi:DNA-binding NtrC family response regulator